MFELVEFKNGIQQGSFGQTRIHSLIVWLRTVCVVIEG